MDGTGQVRGPRFDDTVDTVFPSVYEATIRLDSTLLEEIDVDNGWGKGVA